MPRASSPLLENSDDSPSHVCVVLQPPLPSLAGSRNSSPTQKGSLSDVAQTPLSSMPIILAPSPHTILPMSMENEPEISNNVNMHSSKMDIVEDSGSVEKVSDIRDV